MAGDVGDIETFAGTTSGYSGDGGPAEDAQLNRLINVEATPSGDLFIADGSNHVIRRVDNFGTIETYAGTGVAGYGAEPVDRLAAQFYEPRGMAVDGAGNLFVADSLNNRIRRVEAATGLVTTVAGDGTDGYGGDGGPAVAAQLGNAAGVEVDAAGNLYIADTDNNRIRWVDTSGIIWTIATLPIQGPTDIAADTDGNLYVVEMAKNIVFKLTPASPLWTVTHFAGYGGLPGTGGDGGPAENAFFWSPWGIDVDGAGDVYISDSGNGTIRVVDADTGIINRVAGTTGVWGLSGDGGPALSAELNFPTDSTVDGYGNVYIADRLNHRVRRVFGIATPPFPPPEGGENTPPEWEDWHLGDVHAHAAGDDNLIDHPKCVEENFDEAQCADFLVQDSLARAEVFGTEFVAYTEHAPWLGYQREGFAEFYSAEQAAEEWSLIKDELDAQSTPDIRGLIGSELGTAAPACTMLYNEWPPLRSPGHYGVYYTPEFVDNSMFDCNETGPNGYSDDPQTLGGWGGINHPDNGDGGSSWNCYNTNPDAALLGVAAGLQDQPQLGRPEQCWVGIDQYAAQSPSDTKSFRSMEIINGKDLASFKTLSLWDEFLQNGYRIAAVGGGDAHTAPRDFSLGGMVECEFGLLLGLKVLSECIDDAAPEKDPNHNKIGGSGRTLAFYPAEDVDVTPGSYDSNNPDDPARLAIRTGRTAATNGPQVSAQVAGGYPGSTVNVPDGEAIPVRVDWLPDFSSIGESHYYGDPDESPTNVLWDTPNVVPPEHNHTNEVPDRIVVVIAPRNECGTDRFKCAEQVWRKTIDIVDGQTDDPNVTLHLNENWVEVLVPGLPASNSYVRVEAYYDVGDENAPNTESDRDNNGYPRFIDNMRYDYAAYASPVFVQQETTSSLMGQVLDGVTGLPVPGAGVEVCISHYGALGQLTGMSDCVKRTTAADGSFESVPELSLPSDLLEPKGWYVRAFPPAGVTDRDMDEYEVLGPLELNHTEYVTLTLPEGTPPPYVDPSGMVVDTDGAPLADATVQLWSAPSMDGPFEPVPAGDETMSPGNRQNPVTTTAEGTFAWDVLAGLYKVTATKAGCVSLLGTDAADSGVLAVPPPVLGIELVLDCRPPDTTSPTLSITDSPGEFTNEADITVAFDVADDQPGTGTYCLLDGGPDVHNHSSGGTETEDGPCTSPSVRSDVPEGAHTMTVLAVDGHGNFSVETTPDFTVDRTPPDITVEGVTDGATYTLDDALPTPTCTATDALSGLAGPCDGSTTPPPGGDVGTWTYTATATDRANNTATTTVHWQVVEPSEADVVTVDFTGGITYSNSAELTSGNINVGPTSIFGAVSSVTGSGQIPGTNGGSATVSFNVNAFAGLPVYLGTVAVSDPGAGLSQSTMVLFGKINKAGNTVSSTNSWIKTTTFPWVGYSLRWIVQNNA